MSYFGDGNLSQDILDWIESEKRNHSATNIEVIKALAEIIEYYAEYGD